MKKLIFSAIMMLIAVVSAQAQNITVHGVVISASDDEPLIGATVLSDATKGGTSTDLEGYFELSIPAGTNIRISYVGYQTQTLKGESEMTILLKEDANLLNEVVVVGYQTVRKADLTGSVAVMDMKDPLSENSGNIMGSMAGKLPGVLVIPDAAPGGTGSIRVRGMSNAQGGNNDPLYIVDGVPTDNINMINPSDIESMQVLKDAASASIYGSRAANGVIIITTKQAKGDRMTVNVSYAASLQTIAKRYEVLNANEWGQAYWKAYNNTFPGLTPSHPLYGSGETPQLVPYVAGNPNFPTANTDWQDAIFQSAWTNNLTASVANSTEKSSILFSANYINQQGNVKNSFYERFGARLNSHFDFNKYITIGENLAVARWTNRGADMGGDRGQAYSAMSTHPALPIRGVNGDWTLPTMIGCDLANPLQVNDLAKDNTSESWRILGNAYLEVKPIAGLSIKTNIGIEHSQYFNINRNRMLTPPTEDAEGQTVNTNEVNGATGFGDTWTWTNTANYFKTFAEKHHLTVLLGTEAIQYTFKNMDAARQGYLFTDTDYMQIGSGQTLWAAGGGKSQWSIFSLFGKADYNYDDRYLASFTIRRDENSRFAKGHRAGVFPAVSVAWRPSRESFFPRTTWFNDLKVRYSWGQNGNAQIGDLYPSYSTYINNTGNGAYDMTGSGTSTTPGITLLQKGNPLLTWETTTQHNIGLDLQFLGGALNLTADYYIKKTTDMLTRPDALSVAGENANIWINTGSMRNTGWEISLGYVSPQYGDFSWSGNLNISQYKNKLLALNGQQDHVGGIFRLTPGYAMGIYYGYVCDGIFQNSEEVANHAYQEGASAGHLKYRDLDGNGVIDDKDQCYIGNPNPDLMLGLNLNFRYKRFTLDTFFSGDFGYDIYNHMKMSLYSMSYGLSNINRSKDILNAWSPENNTSDIPALSLDNASDQKFSSYYVENGSYMKMKYIKLGYDFAPSICRKIGAYGINIYAQVENVFTITKYSGLDPELLPGEFGAREDGGAFPRPRTYTLGINLQF